MKLTEYDGNDERRVLIGMITSREVLSAITPKWNKEGLFASRWSNQLGRLCCRYFAKYGNAPGREIESLFKSWASKGHDPENSEEMERFLASLSDQYEEEGNSQYLIDLASKHFNGVRLDNLSDQIRGYRLQGENDKAESLVRSFKRVEMGDDSLTDVLNDRNAIAEAMDPKVFEALIEYPGALGKFFGNQLCRNGFVSILAPEKRGKTWALIDIACEAVLQRRRTAFFEIGDMTRPQIMRRLITRFSERPLMPKVVKWPVRIGRKKTDQGTKVMIKTEDREFKEALTIEEAYASFDRVVKGRVRSSDSYLRLYTTHAGSISAREIRSIVEGWASDGWEPDVIVIDYADLLRMDGGKDMRDKVNEAWQEMRATSQVLHCLVVTATQANRASYKAKRIGMEHSSEDKRKAAHVTGMIGLNQSPGEKGNQLMRLNWVVLREDEHLPSQFVYVAQCLAVARPFMLSTL